ncbi:undecaprenyl/decaprenyl-phosphate alpha-N-acetylglucosaminyl 1-phosphate transferase [Patescibacteria group bacterium]|nr:undecaprenyl/decaprenyl-phosphate alpha-N-acetylglucosaminyl 1-phosphate transferase [Patescibacteria group bacterium]
MNAQLIGASICAFLLTLLGTLASVKYATKHAIFMPPIRKRDVHKKPVPRVGGIAIVLSFTAVVLVVNYFSPDLFAGFNFPFAIFGVSIDKRLLGLLLGGLVLAIIMAVDDFRGLRPWQKLIAQFVVWAIVVGAGIGITHLNNPFGLEFNLREYATNITIGAAVYHFVWIADLLLLFWLVGMMNAMNFIDGADGLAAGIGLIGFVVLGVLSLMPSINQPAVAMLAFIASACVGACLLFNFYPAKVFLGDSGAMWIGYMLAVLSVISGGKLATLFLVLAVVILDGLVVAFFRVKNKQNPFTTSDQSHIHHRFMKAGMSMPVAVMVIWALSALFGAFALFTFGKTKWILIAILSIAVVLFLVLIRRKDEKKEKRIHV